MATKGKPKSKSKPKPKSPRKRWVTAIWVLALTLFMAELLLYAWSRMQCVQIGYAIASESRKQQELKTLENSLRIELTRLKAPEVISRVARKQLGLDLPESNQVVVLP